MSDLIAEEIRVALTRQRMSQRQFATKLGVSPAWLNYRLTGVQEIGVNDLKRIADALGVGVYDLLPPPEVAAVATGVPPEAPRGVKHPYLALSRSDEGAPEPEIPARPIGPRRHDPRRPVSAVPGRTRRPQPVRPGVRRMPR